MFEGVDEAKDWFHRQGLERRVNIIELWRDGENEELEEQTGEHHDDFREMMEQLREINASEDMTSQVLKDELENNGFDTAVALTIINALQESSEPRADLIFLKRNTSAGELQDLVENSIKFYMGRISPEELRDFIREIDEVEDEESDDGDGLAEDLFNRTHRFMQAVVRISIEETGGVARLKNEIRSGANMDEDRIDALFNPIESDLENLQRYHTYYHIKQMRYDVVEINTKIDNLNAKVTEIARRQE